MTTPDPQTPAPTSEAHEGLASHNMTANDLIGLILGTTVDFATHKQALEMVWKYRDAHVSQACAAKDAEIARLKADALAELLPVEKYVQTIANNIPIGITVAVCRTCSLLGYDKYPPEAL